MAVSQYVSEVRADDFDERVVRTSFDQAVLVDFWAPWCGPCKALAPVLEQLAIRHAGNLIIAKVNTDEEQVLAMQHGVRSLPTLMLYRAGKPVKQMIGAQPLAALEAMIAPFLARASDALREKAASLHRAGQRDEAVALLERGLQNDPENYRIHVDLAALLIDLGRLDQAEELLRNMPALEQQSEAAGRQFVRLRLARAGEEAPAAVELERALVRDPNDVSANYYRSAKAALTGDFEEALEGLLKVVRTDRAYRDDAARKAMIDIFTLLGADDPLVKEYRTQLARALN
jgi:putative thioredoxin